MKLKAFDESGVKKEEEPVYLKFKENRDGSITVIGCDKNGEDDNYGRIITLKPNGTIYRWHCVGDNLGFKLNEFGQVEFDDSLPLE